MAARHNLRAGLICRFSTLSMPLSNSLRAWAERVVTGRCAGGCEAVFPATAIVLQARSSNGANQRGIDKRRLQGIEQRIHDKVCGLCRRAETNTRTRGMKVTVVTL